MVEFNGNLDNYLAQGWQIVSTNCAGGDTYDTTYLMTVRKDNEVRVLGYTNFEKLDADTEEDFDPTPYKADFVKILSGGK
jgi:hypothetical protein